MGAGTIANPQEQDLLDRARRGDETAFDSLISPYRGELHAHCYRMLASTHDAEDALQDALLKAWRGISRFEGRSSFRSWLYKIATNASLDAIGRRPKRVLPIDYPATDPSQASGDPLVESVWIEPYPDEQLAIEDGFAGPEASFERREGVELAFTAALQHLPANQRAALILREVLGFSAKEAADMLDTSTASINSALQRARKTVEERLPEQSQQDTIRELGDDGVREVVDAFVEAWDRSDVDGVVAMLTEDAAFTMPPLRTWYGRSREALTQFITNGPLSGKWSWRHIRTTANGQPALAFYSWDEARQTHLPFALNVLTLRGDKISEIDAFICRSTESTDPETYANYPEERIEPRALKAYFEIFGMPPNLD